MKKIIIYIISIILIFLLSIYIGLKIESPNEEQKVEEGIEISKEQEKNNKVNQIEQAISEEKTNKEHYVLKEVGKYVKVYSIDDNEKEELYLSTEISTEYLPETDKINLRKGIHVYSKKELNEMLQDFE